MKTIAEVLKQAELGDLLVSGKYEWKVVDLDFDGSIVATGNNEDTDFEIWSNGIEEVAVIPGLKIVKKGRKK